MYLKEWTQMASLVSNKFQFLIAPNIIFAQTRTKTASNLVLRTGPYTSL